MNNRNELLELRLKLWSFYDDLGTWEKVANIIYHDEVSKALLWKIAKRGHEPKKERIRNILKLKPMVQHPACPTCGGACAYDCGTQRTVNIGKPRHLVRTTIYPNTDPARIVRELARVTGRRYKLDE